MSAVVVFYLVFSHWRSDVVLPMQSREACVAATQRVERASRVQCIGSDGSVYVPGEGWKK